MNFKEPYLLAMHERAPQMYRELKRSGALMSHLQAKSQEAHAMYDQLTDKAEKLPSGAVEDPQVKRQAEEQVFAQMLEFPE